MKLITLKCQYCGLASKMPNDAALIIENGPTDDRGLNHFHLYCRKCHMISDSIGPSIIGLLLGKKFDHQQILDPAKLIASNPRLLICFSPKIQQAMQADGVIWQRGARFIFYVATFMLHYLTANSGIAAAPPRNNRLPPWKPPLH